MKEATVSVVMCTYNGGRYLAEQLDSILEQTYRNLEVIVSDDASTDDSFRILQEYARKDARVKVFRHEANTGFNRNFSFACAQATGRFIAIADQDDIWEHHKLQVLVAELRKKEETVMVHGISMRFEEKDRPHRRSIGLVNYFRGRDIRYFYLLNFVSGHNMVFRRSLLEKALPFPPDFYYDWWLAVQACTAGEVEAVEEVLVWHRMHSSNATGAAKEKVLFYRQTQVNLGYILELEGLHPGHKKFGERLLHYYSRFPRIAFSFPLFWFILTHARIVLAHKKRVFPWISYLKYAWKFSRRSTRV